MSIWQKFDGMTATPATLSQVCEAILAQPIHSPEATRIHMDQELAKAPKPSVFWPALTIIREVLSWSGLLGIAVSLVSCVLGALTLVLGVLSLFVDATRSLLFGSTLSVTSVFGGPLLLCLCGFVVGSLFAAPAILLSKSRMRGPAEWKRYSLGHYLANQWLMPDTAKIGTQAIAATLPNAEMTVHVLEQSGFPIDPVLEVAYNNPITGKREIAYPYIWDINGNLLAVDNNQP